MKQITFHFDKDFSVGLVEDDILEDTKVKEIDEYLLMHSSFLNNDFIFVNRKDGNILIAKDKIKKITFK